MVSRRCPARRPTRAPFIQSGNLTRLRLLQAQDATLILRHSFSTPFIQHLLRGIFCGDNLLLQTYDEKMRRALSQALNIELEDSTWQQATLPISAGGLGVKRAVVLSSSAFLSSVRGAESLITQILQSCTSIASLQSDPLVQQSSQFRSRQVII